jgi:glycosyltransferase involved in cell wall biosynthesis
MNVGMLRVGIDGRPFQGPLAGTGRYVRELCVALDRLLPDAQFFIYSNRPISMPVMSKRWLHVNDPSPLMRRLPAAFWYLERAGALIRRDAIDVFWGAANFLPRRIRGHVRTILTVLDMVPDLYPETIGLKHRLVYKMYFPLSFRKADRLIAISKGTKDRFLEQYGRIIDEIIYPCVSEHFKRPDSHVLERVRIKYELQKSFFLAVATLEPRKNLTAVLQAMIYLKGKGLSLPTLVLVGQVGWKTEALFKMIKQAQMVGVCVVQTGFVPDEDLPALYSASSAFIFPSVYEGFGMPVLEALQCGAIVLASDTPEIREAGGKSAIYFEPTAEGIALALETFLTSYTKEVTAFRHQDKPFSHGSTWEKEGMKLVSLIKLLA